MTKLLCQINDEPFHTKPTDNRFMGRLRDKMIQRPWSYIHEEEFIDKITHGHAFYGNLFDGHDLMETGQQRLCWRAQTIIAVDIDHCSVDPQAMCRFYTDLGYIPWLAYPTFSDGDNGLRSYRILWRVEVDHRITYEQWSLVIKGLSNLTDHGDPRARDCTRMWQGGWSAPVWHVPGLMWNYQDFAKNLGLLN